MRILSFFDRLFQRTPKYYTTIVIAFAQLISIPGAVLGAASIQLNAGFSSGLLRQASLTTPFIILLGNVILLVIAWRMTPNARKKLVKTVQNLPGENDPVVTALAWQEISGLAWRYGIVAAPVAFLVDILPSSLYFYSVGLSNFDQMLYALIGGFVSVLATVILASVLIERLLLPARQTLLPNEIDAQLGGIRGAPIGSKLLIISIALVIIGILMVAPIGYHKLVSATINIFDPAKILYNLQLRQEMQVQSILVSIATIALSFGLFYAISRSITVPISSMIKTFQEVESGKLSQRANVDATDEIGVLAIHFNRMVARLETLQNSLEEQVKERTEQLEAINEVGRAVSAILDLDELIAKVVNLITDRFGYYYASLFLLDPSEKWAELRSATGEAGRVLKESRHRLEVGGKSMVGSAIAQRSARIALDVGSESVRFDNPLLPYTRSEIALPLVVGDRVLGALDVQSTKPSAFGPQDIETLQNMTNQVAVALENARLFQETRARIQELQASQRQYLQEAWTSLSKQENLEYELGEEGQSEVRLNVPLSLRDQIIGQISLAGDAEWSQEDRAWVESVATQAAIALENARLLDHSQRTAAFEKIVAEITGKVWASSSIEGIMQTSVRELGRALNATEVVIELGPDEDKA